VFKYLLIPALVLGLTTAAVADEKPYKDGPVTQVSFVKVKDGKMLDYLAQLDGPYKKEMEAYKKAGLILDWHVYQAQPHNPSDANVILTVTYPNYAALDRSADFDAIDVKLAGSLKSMETSYGERDSMREVLGSDLLQEMILK
jgi:hypothetical protein